MNKLLKYFVLSTKNSVLENCLLCAAITLTSGFIFHDSFYGFMGVIRAVTVVLIFIVWIYCAMTSGRNKKYGFLIFASLYWTVPYFYMMFYDMRDNVHHFSKWLDELDLISDLVFNGTFAWIADKMHYDPFAFVITLLVLTYAFYFVGLNINSLYVAKVNSGEYEDDEDVEYD